MPTLSSIVGKEDFVSVRSSTNVREASSLMARCRKAILVIDDDELLGIFTPKDLLDRIVAPNKSPDLTAISSVMTEFPHCLNDDATILDALHEMHESKIQNISVKKADGRVIGLVDVMDLLQCSFDEDNWKTFFAASGDREFSDESSSRHELSPVEHRAHVPPTAAPIYRMPSQCTDMESAALASVNVAPLEFALKVNDTRGNTHRIKVPRDASFDTVRRMVAEKVALDETHIVLKYIDEEKDEVMLNSDASLKDAMEFSRSSGQPTLKITASVPPIELIKVAVASGQLLQNKFVIGGVLTAVTAVALGVLVYVRGRK